MAILYIHKKLDDKEVFYVGIGKNQRRAFSSYSRNKMWHSVVNKHGIEVEILQNNLNWEEACLLEIEMISKYGRRDKNTGCLVNMTAGGDGLNDISEETRHKLRISSLGKKQSEESKRKTARPGILSPNYGKFGELHPKFGKKHNQGWTEEAKIKKSESMKGVSYSQERKDSMKVPKGPQNLKECPHCGKIGGNAMLRWHFDNCKYKN
jgi:hypothetical protein